MKPPFDFPRFSASIIGGRKKMSTLERLKQRKADLLKDSADRKARLDAQIAQTKANIAKADRAKTQTAKSHLKHVWGGWCLAMMENPSASPDFKQILLISTDEVVTQNPDNLARKMFEAYKQKAGV
jgi:hypothetical protein